MPDCMTFPDTVEEFMEQYKVVDTEQVYTNGTEFVPIYRMRQWFQHEPETHEERTETHACDCISRQKAFEYFVTLWECIGTIMDRDEWEDVCMTTANEIPSVPEPETVRCKDCRWRKDQSGSTAWLPCRAIVTPSDFYCSFAERRTDGV